MVLVNNLVTVSLYLLIGSVKMVGGVRGGEVVDRGGASGGGWRL